MVIFRAKEGKETLINHRFWQQARKRNGTQYFKIGKDIFICPRIPRMWLTDVMQITEQELLEIIKSKVEEQ